MNKELTASCIRYLINISNGHIKPAKDISGICYNLHRHIMLTEKTYVASGYIIVLTNAINWPHNNGSRNWPVPNDNNFSNLWHNPLRLDLCRHIIKELSATM